MRATFAGKIEYDAGKESYPCICEAGDGMEKFFPADKLMITGKPRYAVRSLPMPSVVQKGWSSWADAAKKTVLATGGSLGAKGINEALDANIDLFAKNDIQLIWQSGKPYVERASELAVESKNYLG